MTTPRIIKAEGYAPEVPAYVDVRSAGVNTLVLIIRDAIQNGQYGTRANLALQCLLEKLAIPAPELPLDEQPYLNPKGERTAAKQSELEDKPGTIVNHEFRPRFGFSQDFADYRPKPTEMGWYDDPDGSGKERWWMGTMWADTYREPEKKAKGRR